MKKTLSLIAVSLLFTISAYAGVVEQISQHVTSSTKMNQSVKTFVVSTLIPLMSNPIFVDGVKAQNAKDISMEVIKRIDREWQEAEEELPIHKELMGNAVGMEIKRFIQSTPAVVEAFVMDNKGANVGQNDLTSDYWQGDEAKWKNSYNNGKGGLDVGKEKFDVSANTTLQQISLPIIDGEKVVGAICIGLNISRL